MYERERPKPRPTDRDRTFWIAVKDHLAHWEDTLVVVKPSTVLRWHRQGFQYYWRWKSQGRRPGRPALDLATRRLIRTMALENRWRAPRIAKELGRLGIEVHEDTVRRYMPKVLPTERQRQSWRRFLRNHRGVLAAMDLFVVPTVTFRLLYGFLVIHHGRRLVLHFNTTVHPTSAWVCQQLREAFPFDTAPRYLIFDRDSILNASVVDTIRSMGIKPARTAFRSPWQNPVAERWIGSFRRELLDHVVVQGEQHLRRLGQEYIAYYNEDRCHTTLDGDSPAGRPVQSRPGPNSQVIALPRAAGLHHRYEWRDAA
jgi:transposase InsO family protein